MLMHVLSSFVLSLKTNMSLFCVKIFSNSKRKGSPDTCFYHKVSNLINLLNIEKTIGWTLILL